jgi:hypothetical protein
MDQGTQNIILSWIAIVISVGSIIIGIINHKKITSSCCGKKAEMSLDISSTSPTKLDKPEEIR